MNALHLSLFGLLSFNGNAIAQSEIADRTLPDGFKYAVTGTEYRHLKSVEKEAIRHIDQAIKNRGNNLNKAAEEFGGEIIRTFKNVRYAVSTNAEEARCKDLEYFVDDNYRDVIFVCRHTMEAIANDDAGLTLKAAQFLIREGVLIARQHSPIIAGLEITGCRATYFELIIMENNYGIQNIPSMHHRDKYKARCGFKEYDHVPSERKQSLAQRAAPATNTNSATSQIILQGLSQIANAYVNRKTQETAAARSSSGSYNSPVYSPPVATGSSGRKEAPNVNYCLSMRNGDLYNSCAFTVAAAWCVSSSGYCKFDSTWNISAGSSYPIVGSGQGSVHYMGCRGADTQRFHGGSVLSCYQE